MTKQEFLTIKNMLVVYKGFCSTNAEIEAWYESLRSYSFAVIEEAVRSYVRSNSYMPTPAAIIGLIPRAKTENTRIRYECIDGRVQRVVNCRRCWDTGLIIWADEEGRNIGRPCDCAAGHENYKGYWTVEESYEEKNKIT